jgi:ubiquinone/menaquinone biosynthesis C-methylase UbiE
MKQGDFTTLAKDYINRTGYSLRVLKALAAYIGSSRDGFTVADIGAGTGKLTENLIELKFKGYAVEPNDAMRGEGERLCQDGRAIVWSKGSAEHTGLSDSCVDWIFMASSFHWTKPELALREFRRILRPGGFFTALWNPRDIENNELHKRIESRIHAIAPHISRVSSGSKKYTEMVGQTLVSTGDFGNLIFMEAPHEVTMSPERYLGAWNSVNDVQAQAGKDGFAEIMKAIESEIAGLESVVVPYKTRAWTVQLMQKTSHV